MPTAQWKLCRCVVTVIATTILTTTAVADDAKTDEAEPPQRQMLYKIFAPIMHDMGSCNLQKATVVSGPIEMKMTNNKQPGKQWWVRLGQSRSVSISVPNPGVPSHTTGGSFWEVPPVFRPWPAIGSSRCCSVH